MHNLSAPSKVRVLFASYHCYHDPSNGAAVCTRDLFGLLAGQGWACGVLTGPFLDNESANPVSKLLADLPGLQTVHGTVGDLTFSVHSIVDAVGFPVSTFDPDPPAPHREPTQDESEAFLETLRRVLIEFEPDVVLTYGGDQASRGIAALAHRAGAKVAFWLHNYAYGAWCFDEYDAVIVPSAHTRDHYRTVAGIEATVLPGPFDTARLVCDRVEGRFVTFVNPAPYKGVFWFARIAHELGTRRPDIPILVVEGRVGVSWLDQCGIDLTAIRSVHRMPNIPDPRQFYSVSRLMLVPSLWDEALGRVAVEAMLNGVPVAGSGRGGLSEVLATGGVSLPIPDRYTPSSQVPPEAGEVSPWVDWVIRLWDDPLAYSTAAAEAKAGGQKWMPATLLPRWQAFLAHLAPK
jgi:glycosyltransferase involved in cell wall biosynthesis